ncbi:NUDIX domain-containing protein, partial [Candidatus Woesearchaeota archaeon]|nr:NUDIX domain-containing protein [Candidatus Woesearchaeota archaeon]
NENDEVIDVKSISEVHRLGLIHREAAVYLIDSKQGVLLQKRNDNRLWDPSAAGHFSKEESYIEGAKREFEEELGIGIDISKIEEIAYERRESIKPDKKNIRFLRVFAVRKDVPINDFKIDHNEVEEVRYFNKKELQDLLSKPYLLTTSNRAMIERYILKMI